MHRIIATIALCAATLLASQAQAFELNPDEIRGKSSKESVTVLQNRYFLKANRPEFGLMVGAVLDEAYLNTTTMGARTGFFLSEWLGFEVGMLRTTVSDSDDRRALNTLQYRPRQATDSEGNAIPDEGTTEVLVSPDPEVNAIRSITDFTANLAPFYGKLNLLNSWIVYTDLYLSSGIARMETDQGTKTAIALGLGERFYIGKAWSVRVDFKDRIFSEQRAGKSTRKHSLGVDLGTSYFFN